jgi:hypothetical protein
MFLGMSGMSGMAMAPQASPLGEVRPGVYSA